MFKKSSFWTDCTDFTNTLYRKCIDFGPKKGGEEGGGGICVYMCVYRCV